jgi:transposase InsO family protein
MIEFIDQHRDVFGVEPICAELPIAPATYYAAKSRPPSARAVSDAVMIEKIRSVHAANYGVYGVRKVHAQLLLADITYVRTFTGWVYAAFVTDVFSRRIVGWQLSTSLRTDLALDALDMGIWSRTRQGRDLSRLIHHSDRGVQGGFNWSSQHHLILEVFTDGDSGLEQEGQRCPGGCASAVAC